MHYAVNTFDGRAEFLSGKRKGDWAGLQSWKYYEKRADQTLEFKKKTDKHIARFDPAELYPDPKLKAVGDAKL